MSGRRLDVRFVAMRLLLAACLLSARAFAEDCEVRLGAVGPMSGSGSGWGMAVKAGAELAAALTNEAGGLRVGDRTCRVKVYTYDSQYTAAGAAAASNFLASENVHVTLGPVGSPETTGFRPVAKRHRQVAFSSSSMAKVITPEFPLVFHAIQGSETYAPILIAEAKARFKIGSVVILGPNDQAGTDKGRQLARYYADAGIKTREEYFQRGTTNFAPLVLRIMAGRPDAIETSAITPGDATILVKQLMEAGYAGAIGSLGGIPPDLVIQSAGGVEKLRAYYWLELAPSEHPGVLQMKAEYQRIFKAPPPENALFPVFTVCGEQALRAISLAGTDQDGEKIAEVLRRSAPESRFLGKAGWRGMKANGINQEMTFPIGLGMVADGRRLGVKTISIPTE